VWPVAAAAAATVATLPHPLSASTAPVLTAEAGGVADVAWAAVGAIAMSALLAAVVLL